MQKAMQRQAGASLSCIFFLRHAAPPDPSLLSLTCAAAVQRAWPSVDGMLELTVKQAHCKRQNVLQALW